MRTDFVELGEFSRLSRNAKKHDPEIGKSIGRWGYLQPVVVNETTGHLIAGHGRIDDLEARRRRGQQAPKNIEVQGEKWLVPTAFVSVPEREEEAVAVSLNRTSEKGGWDKDLLTNILADITEAGSAALEGVGFSQKELDGMLEAQAREAEPEPEMVFTEELLEEHQYLVLYFDNSVDWQTACDVFGVKAVRAFDDREGHRRRGLGRVIRGADVLKKLRKGA